MTERMVNRAEPLVHEDDVEAYQTDHGRFSTRRRLLGMATGARKLGCSLYEIPPGKTSFPYHWHAANEEALYVLEGEGSLRLGGRVVPIRRGCFVTLRTGLEGAHQVLNTSAAPLRYLCFSTMLEPEIAFYPDSGKIALFLGGAPGSVDPNLTLTVMRGGAEVDFWDGEE